jgi:hypothetical protein
MEDEDLVNLTPLQKERMIGDLIARKSLAVGELNRIVKELAHLDLLIRKQS